MSVKNKKSKRIFYFDALRALAIITVIMFHVYLRIGKGASVGWGMPPSPGWIATDLLATIARCGVAIFLMLSGALSLGRVWDIKPFLQKRLPRIAMPFVFWTVVLASLIVLVYYFHPFSMFNYFHTFDFNTISTFFYNAFMGDTVWFTPYWFFWMILGTYLIMPVLNKWLLHADLKEAEYFLVIWLVTCLFSYTINFDFPVNLKYFTGPIGLVVLGYYLRHTDRKIFNNIYYAIAIFLASAIALVGLSYMFSTPSEFYVFERYSILFAFEVTGIFCIFKNFGQLNINWKFLSNPDSIFRKSVFSIAKYSYGIYLTHQFVMNFLVIFLVGHVRYTFLIVILVILTLVISWGGLAILNRVPYLNQWIGAK
ncbi:acyltransferase [uncultured Methanobrevibacter sp.]|uniref:acyltransferase n=1 Tax=uncultured Methanobrevibacter sp. TaxID=253161 RepID=UPI0025D9BFD2|nr:acyltransferase [uncultured Methanobrevibacter sp.]